MNSFDELLNDEGRIAINVIEYKGGRKNYIIEKIFDNYTLEEPVVGVGEYLAGSNQFSIIAKKIINNVWGMER